MRNPLSEIANAVEENPIIPSGKLEENLPLSGADSQALSLSSFRKDLDGRFFPCEGIWSQLISL